MPDFDLREVLKLCENSAWIAFGVAAVGFLGSLFFKSREKKEKEARQKLEEELRKNIDSICDKLAKDMKKQCKSMLSQQIDSLLKELNRVIQVVSNLSRVQSQLAWQINGHVLDINRQLLHSGLDRQLEMLQGDCVSLIQEIHASVSE